MNDAATEEGPARCDHRLHALREAPQGDGVRDVGVVHLHSRGQWTGREEAGGPDERPPTLHDAVERREEGLPDEATGAGDHRRAQMLVVAQNGKIPSASSCTRDGGRAG